MSERGQNQALQKQRCARSVGWRWIYRLGSLRLAMILLLTIALACAVATICESKFNRQVAEVYIYRNPFFLLWLLLLCLNLICSAWTRWPWQRRHLGFVVTHGGIIILLLGAMIGHFFGFEAVVDLLQGAPPTNCLTTNQTVLMVQGAESGQFYQAPLNVSVRPPTATSPRVMPMPESNNRLVLTAYSDRLVIRPGLTASGNPAAPFGVELELNSQRMETTLPVTLLSVPAEAAVYDMSGLALICLVPELSDRLPQVNLPTLFLAPNQHGGLDYRITHPGRPALNGELTMDDGLATGWLDWYVRVRRIVPHAAVTTAVQALATADPQAATVTGFQAHLRSVDGREGEAKWVTSGVPTTLSLGDTAITVGFGLRQIRLPFAVSLEQFQVPRIEGTEQPENFISQLIFHTADGGRQHAQAEMNHPASYPGGWWRLLTGLNYKFSQAGWDPRDLQRTTLQVLYDPGWLCKWVGSLLICTGIVLLFYFRPRPAGG